MTKSYPLIAALAAPLLFLSCSREVVETGKISAERAESPALHIPTGFTASLPGSGPLKTSLRMGADGTGTLLWDKDDPVMVSNGSESMTMYIEEGGSTTAGLYSERAVFEGNDFFAVYPANESAAYGAGEFTTSVPARQKYVPGGFDKETAPMVAICDSKRNFSFRNAASLLEVIPVPPDESLKGEALTSVSVTAFQAMAGTVHVTFNDSGEIETRSGEGSRTVTVSGEGMKFGEPVWFVVAPGQYSELKVRVSLQNGQSYRANLDENVTVERSRWARVEAVMSDGYTDLSADGPANCYLITRPGSYMFRADIKGNGIVPPSCEGLLAPEITDGADVAVYHTDGVNFLFGDLSYNGGYINFTTTDELNAAGSVLLSLRDGSGRTLWSWHLWANPELDDIVLSNGQVWMNMNLGALHTGFDQQGYNGYYYQWGRKDPFLQKATTGTAAADLAPFVSHASQTDGSIANSILHPEIFYGGYQTSDKVAIEDWSNFDDKVKYYDLWNASCTGDGQVQLAPSKTMFDPCPPGYHVPAYTEVQQLQTLSDAWENNGRLVEDCLFFPASSYRYINLYADYWFDKSPRAFFWCALPHETGAKNYRRGVRPYYTKSSKGIGNGPRSYAIPVRCINDDIYTPVVPVSGVEISLSELTLVLGDSFLLNATVLPENATDKTVVWSSSDESVVQVRESGLVVAAGAGTAEITATASGFSAVCRVTVTATGGSFSTVTEDLDPEVWE